MELNFQSISKEDIQEDLRPFILTILNDKSPKETFHQQIQDITEANPGINNMRLRRPDDYRLEMILSSIY